jgi:predicted acetyltransferase
MAPEWLAGQEIGDGELRLVLAGFEACHPIHKVPAYVFRMVHGESGEDMGHVNLRVGSTAYVERYAGHIGYGVREEHRGHGYAARAVRLLLPVARRLGIDPVWITCDPENAASRRTLERAGAVFVEIVDVPPDCAIYRSGHPRKCRYRLEPGTPAAAEEERGGTGGTGGESAGLGSR